MEPLRGYLTLAERLYEHGASFAEGWNFGPHEEDIRPVNWIAKHMCSLWGGDAKWQVDYCEQPHEANYLKLDISKARNRLNWHPALRMEDALKLILDWDIKYRSGVNMRTFTLSQIHAYQAITKSE